MSEIVLDLRGKDYLSVAEAAHYCCVSLSQFKQNERELLEAGISPSRVMGKKVYKRADLARYMDNAPQWHQSASAAIVGISTGARTTAPAASSPLVPAQRNKRRSLAKQRLLS